MYKKLAFFVLLILAIFLAFAGCKKLEIPPKAGKEQIQKPGQLGIPLKKGEVVARVNEEVLTEKDLEAILPEAQKSSISLEQERDYVRRWIENQILYQEAKKKRIDQDENIKWRIDQAVRSIIIEGFLEKELQARVAVPEEEVKRTYQENKTMFKREQDEVRLSRILVKNIAEAGLVSVRMQGGESFAQIAKQMSLDEETKERGGDIGYVPLSKIPPPFYETVTKLKIGEISIPIQTDYGFVIIMLTDKKEKDSIKEYEQVKEEITDSLTLAKQKKELENLFEELKKTAKVETFGWATGIFPQ